MTKAIQTPRLDVTRYRGQWVALHPETKQVVSHRPSFKAAKREAMKRGVSRPVLYAVPQSDAYFLGCQDTSATRL